MPEDNEHSPSSSAPTFLARVKQALATLHPAEKQLAEFILDFPGELASYSASELASLAGVSNSTVSRFIRRIGYNSFEAARRHVREGQQSGSALFLTGRENLQSTKTLANYIESGQQNLQQTLHQITEEQAKSIAERLLKARSVWVIGFRSSQSLASYFGWQLYQLRDNVHRLPTAEGSLGEHISAIEKDDLVIMFGLRRRPSIWPQLRQLCLDTQAPVLLITDDHVATDLEVHWHLQCACTGIGPLDNHTSVLAICHLLLNIAFEHAGSIQRRRLTESVLLNQQLGEI